MVTPSASGSRALLSRSVHDAWMERLACWSSLQSVVLAVCLEPFVGLESSEILSDARVTRNVALLEPAVFESLAERHPSGPPCLAATCEALLLRPLDPGLMSTNP